MGCSASTIPLTDAHPTPPSSSSLIGDLDVEKDKAQDLSQLRADPIPETRHF